MQTRSRIHVGQVKEFAADVERIRKALKRRQVLPLMFAYRIHPCSTQLGKALGIRLIASCER